MNEQATAALKVGRRLSVGANGANLLHLSQDFAALQAAGVEIVHIDVMDGVFCPQMTVGPSFVRAIPDTFTKDVHLMIDEPLGKVEEYVAAGADILTFHVEATRHAHYLLRTLAAANVMRGVAIKPGTPLTAIEPLIDELDYVLILAVEPGRPGERFHSTAGAKLIAARELLAGRGIFVGIDGGVTKQNAREVASLSPDVVVAGSAIFDGEPLVESARRMLKLCRGRASADGAYLSTESYESPEKCASGQQTSFNTIHSPTSERISEREQRTGPESHFSTAQNSTTESPRSHSSSGTWPKR